MADEGAETPTVLPKIDFYSVLQTAASYISNQHGNRFDNVNKDDGLYWDALGCNWPVLSCNGVFWAILS